MNLIEKLTDNNYLGTEDQIEQLARERFTSDLVVKNTDTTFLRVILAGAKAELPAGKKNKRKLAKKVALEVVEKIYGIFYPAVLRGVTTPEAADDETLSQEERTKRSLLRNARSNFARTSKHELVKFIKGGGNISALDVAETTKETLRKALRGPEPTDRFERIGIRSLERLQRSITRQARENWAGAHDQLAQAIQKLEEQMEELVKSKPGKRRTAKQAAVRRTGGESANVSRH